MIQFILKPKKEKLVLLLCLFVCVGSILQCFYRSVIITASLTRHVLSEAPVEKKYISRHTGWSQTNKQTAGEGDRDTSETSQVWGRGFEVRFISTSAVAVSEFLRLHLCVVLCIFVQLGHVVKHLAPSDYSWCKNRTLLSLKQKKPTDY